MIYIQNYDNGRLIRSKLEELYMKDPSKRPKDYNLTDYNKFNGILESELQNLSFISYTSEYVVKEPSDIEFVKKSSIFTKISIDTEITKEQLNEIGSNCQNLKELNIYKNIKTPILDFKSFKNLEKIKICNQETANFIQIGNLKKIQSLSIINNPFLSSIKGIDLLDKIDEIKIYENQNLDNSFLYTIKEKAKQADIVLDSIYYSDIIKIYGLDDTTKKFNWYEYDDLFNHIKWLDRHRDDTGYNEFTYKGDINLNNLKQDYSLIIKDSRKAYDEYMLSIKNGEPFEEQQRLLNIYKEKKNVLDSIKGTCSSVIPQLFSSESFYGVYKKAKSVIDTYIKDTDTDIEKYAMVYTWVTNNIKYDHESIEDDSHTHHIFMPNGTRIQTGPKLGTNTTYNGLINGECVCEGYSKVMKFLLNMCNIKSKEVHNVCDIKGKKEPHSSLALDLGNGVFYSDSTWDSTLHSYDYFYMTEDEFKKEHDITIPVYKGEKRSNPLSYESKIELAEFARNRLFIKSFENKTELSYKDVRTLFRQELSNMEIYGKMPMIYYLDGNFGKTKISSSDLEEAKLKVNKLFSIVSEKCSKLSLGKQKEEEMKTIINEKLLEVSGEPELMVDFKNDEKKEMH